MRMKDFKIGWIWRKDTMTIKQRKLQEMVGDE